MFVSERIVHLLEVGRADEKGEGTGTGGEKCAVLKFL